MGLDQKVTWIGTGNVDTMMGSLKKKQVDVLVSSLSLLNDSKRYPGLAGSDLRRGAFDLAMGIRPARESSLAGARYARSLFCVETL